MSYINLCVLHKPMQPDSGFLQFEERFLQVLEEVSAADGRIILFIDEIHTVRLPPRTRWLHCVP